MKLEGQLEEIIYQNETNSYTIAELSTDEEIYTIENDNKCVSNCNSTYPLLQNTLPMSQYYLPYLIFPFFAKF